MKMAKFYILDKNFETLAHIDSYKSILWSDKYDEPGSFELVCAPSETMLKYCVMDNYIWNSNSDTLMIIEKIEYKSSFEDGLEIIVSGRDLRVILERRVLLLKAKFNGNLEDSIRQILNYCIINPYTLQGEGQAWSTAEFEEKVYYKIINQKVDDLISDGAIPESIYISKKSFISEGILYATLKYTQDSENKEVSITDESLKTVLNGLGTIHLESDDFAILTDWQYFINFDVYDFVWYRHYYTKLQYNTYDQKRKISNFVFRYSGNSRINGQTINNEFSQGTNLLEVVQTLCRSKNIGFKIFIEGRQFVFQLTVGDDHSYNQSTNPWIIFSPKHNNLISTSFNYDKGINYANFVYFSDNDDHTDNVSTGLTGLYRKEAYQSTGMSMDDEDKSSTENESKYMARFKQKGTDILKERAISMTTDSEVETRFHTEYGVDYFIGDVVQLENEFGIKQRLRVTEFVTSYSMDGFQMYPTLTEIVNI